MHQKTSNSNHSSLSQKTSTVTRNTPKPLETPSSEDDAEPPPVRTAQDHSTISGAIQDPDDSEPPGSPVTSPEFQISLQHDPYRPLGALGTSDPGLKLLRNRSSGTIGASKTSKIFRNRLFPWSTESEWNDWKWQFKNRITCVRQLERFINLSNDEMSALTLKKGLLPFAITPYYASLLDRDDSLQPIRRSVVPVISEQERSFGESDDPLGEEDDSPVPGIVHRYPDRVLFLATTSCSVYCRYCTRSRMVGSHDRHTCEARNWERSIDYIAANPAIRDVLISGGDPLVLSNEKLEYLLASLRRIPHVELLRIGTKVPVVLPQRITLSLVKMLKRYHPLWMSIHFTHPDELTPEVYEATGRLADSGIPLGSQTVLLKGINDNVQTMGKLLHGLLKIRVRPYYLYQCDPITGSSHFRTSVEKGIEIIKGLRGHTSGYAVPQYVIDAPGGGGKIPVNPLYVAGREGDYLLLQNYEGLTFRYPDPVDSSQPDYGKPERAHLSSCVRCEGVIA